MALIPFRQRVFAMKQQVAQGTWNAPSFSTDAILFLNGATNTEADEFAEEVDRGYFGEFPATVANQRGSISGDVRLVGHPTAGTVPPWDALMRNAGHAVVTDTDHVIYSPVSSGLTYLSGHGNHGDRDVQLLDCRTQLERISFEIGSSPLLRFVTRGELRQDPADVSTPAGTFTGFPSPLPVSKGILGVTIGGTPIETFSAVLELNATVAQVTHSIRTETALSDRRPRLRLRLNRQALSVVNWYTLARARTEIAVVVTLTDASAVAKQVRLSIPYATVQMPSGGTDNSGFVADEIELRCLPSGGAGTEYALRLGALA